MTLLLTVRHLRFIVEPVRANRPNTFQYILSGVLYLLYLPVIQPAFIKNPPDRPSNPVSRLLSFTGRSLSTVVPFYNRRGICKSNVCQSAIDLGNRVALNMGMIQSRVVHGIGTSNAHVKPDSGVQTPPVSS
jgi:hypothetical protein